MTGDCGDMAVDRSGRVYLDVGCRRFDGEERRPGRLLRIDPGGSVSVVVETLAFPAGLGISENGSRLIVAEGRAATLHCFDLTAEGELTEQRVFARLPNTVLGGLALDAAGAVRQCCPEDRAVLRMLNGGTITHVVRLPLQPTACCLGGADLRTLYVAAADDAGERMVKEECRAEVFTVGVATPGFARRPLSAALPQLISP
jgi:sugar lactone lactonase YvrE